MKNTHVYIVIGHKNFSTGKIVIVSVPNYSEYITTYEREAKLRACNKLNIRESEAVVLDCKVLGHDVLFID